MSDSDAWDADDFEPQQTVAAVSKTDKWEGEDEEDEIKDNWDDDDDKEESAQTGETVSQVKKKKPLKERIAEKEAKRKAEIEERRKKEEEERRNMTAEEIATEKLRQRQIQEESDLKLAKEAFGIKDDPSAGIDACAPVSKEEFETFESLLSEKITKYHTSAHYVSFLETLFRNVALDLEPEDIKKLGSTLNTLCNEKVKAQKGKTKKKKGGAKLVVSKNTDDLENYGDYVDDYDDFI